MPREQDVIKSTVLPVTQAQITGELLKLGLEPGNTVLLFASLSSLSWVVGREQAVVQAVISALSPGGTVVCPSFTPWNTDPANWKDVTITSQWFPLVRANMPGFDPKLSPAQGVGVVAECLRTHPEAHRSGHPTSSFVAVGPEAEALTKNHTIMAAACGAKSPLGKLYDHPNSKILLLGAGWEKCSATRYAEALSGTSEKLVQGSSVKQGEDVEWMEWIDIKGCDREKLRSLGEQFEKECGSKIVRGKVGKADARLFSFREFADFTIAKLKEKAHI